LPNGGPDGADRIAECATTVRWSSDPTVNRRRVVVANGRRPAVDVIAEVGVRIDDHVTDLGEFGHRRGPAAIR
jgi:hypothetical protein